LVKVAAVDQAHSNLLLPLEAVEEVAAAVQLRAIHSPHQCLELLRVLVYLLAVQVVQHRQLLVPLGLMGQPGQLQHLEAISLPMVGISVGVELLHLERPA
jgi:hypothetical protein